MTGLIAKRIAFFAWNGSGLDPEETVDGMDQAEYADVIQDIIDGKGPKWVLKAVTE